MCQALSCKGLGNLLCLLALVLLLFSLRRSTRQFVSPLPEEYTVRMSRSPASGYKNAKRVRQYGFAHRDVPATLNGYRLVFISDLRYGSLLKKEGLEDITCLLNDLHPDTLLIGGDLHEGCEYAPDVIAALGTVKTPLGTYAVLGDNDYKACYGDVLKEMERQGIHLLEHKADILRRNGEHIVIAGVRNPFDIGQNEQLPTLSLAPENFVVLLTHTPGYAEGVPITSTGLVLAGHTHGGQMTVFGLYAPIVPSHYGQRFLTGLKYNSNNTPIIIINGIGTSNKNVRLFALNKVVVIALLSHP